MPASKTLYGRPPRSRRRGSAAADAARRRIADEPGFRRALENGAPEAIELLFRIYRDEMRRIALALTGSPADADDIVQDVFLRLPCVIGTFEGRATIGCWLRRVTRRQALQHLRGQRRRRETVRRFGAQYRTPTARPLDRITLERALDALPEHYRDVIVLRHVHGLTHSEIARTLGITENLSGVRLFRAQALLRDALREP